MVEKMEQEKIILEKIEKAGQAILQTARDELYMRMRFMDVALCSFRYQMSEEIETIGTDGDYIYYRPRYLGGIYSEDPVLVNRAYLHMVLHCIFRHHVKCGDRKKIIWDLASDITIEAMIDEWDIRNVKRSRSWLRREMYRRLKEEMSVFTAERIYLVLEKQEIEGEKLGRLQEEFYVDSHQYWDIENDPKKKMEQEQKWQDMSEQMETDMQTFSKEASSSAGHLLDQLRVENRERYDYRAFLRKFAVIKEEIRVDEDTFDYTFYTYGLQLYGNMPLIEPQEWKEVKKVEEFVIVIDTSMSCSKELVKQFLEETYSILSEQESFFHKINIHIIQCDEQIQDDTKIENQEELKQYMEHLELRGEGGTDFCPAFDYVNQMVLRKEFENLKGMIYFTDGFGTYPNQMPSYETAFIFMEEDYQDQDVPAWAMKIIISKKELS